MRFRDATHAAVTFSTSAVDIRGEIALDEGEVHITSTQHMVLTGTPFRIEVEPATALRLVNGLRHEVTCASEPLVDGLDLAVARLRGLRDGAADARRGAPRGLPARLFVGAAGCARARNSHAGEQQIHACACGECAGLA